MRTWAAATVVLAMLAASFAASGTGASTVIEFRTPTGNIGCVFSSGLTGAERPALRCDIRSRLRPEPAPPKNCRLDSGDSLQIFPTGRPSLVCHGDTAIDPAARVLAYGHIWRRAGLSCTSRSIGLTCANTVGHGFFLSRQSWRTF